VARGDPAVAGWPAGTAAESPSLFGGFGLQANCDGAAAEHSLLGWLVGQKTNSAHTQGCTKLLQQKITKQVLA